MSKEQSEELIKKYLAAETSLEEEEQLFNAKDQHPEIREWSMYVKQKRKKTPSNFNDSIWESIQSRRRSKQRFLVRLSGIAASIVLCLGVFFYKPLEKNINNGEEDVLLEEVISMLAENDQPFEKQSIIYEDDMIIIYLASE